MPILDMNTMKVESKWHETKEKIKMKAQMAAQWVRDNPQAAGMILTLGAGAIGGVAKVCKNLGRTINLSKERYNKERYIYDHSLGMYLHTKRPLRNQDYKIIKTRQANGERLADILLRMNILD